MEEKEYEIVMRALSNAQYFISNDMEAICNEDYMEAARQTIKDSRTRWHCFKASSSLYDISDTSGGHLLSLPNVLLNRHRGFFCHSQLNRQNILSFPFG